MRLLKNETSGTCASQWNHSRVLFHYGLLFLLLCSCFKPCCAQKKDAFPYHFPMKREALLVGGTIALTATSYYLFLQKPSVSQATLDGLDRTAVPRFDRSALNNFSTESARASDVTLLTGVAAGSLVVWAKGKGWNNKVKLGILYTETMVLNLGLTELFKNSFDRARPFLYNPTVSDEEKLKDGKDNLRSFYSGHASFAFTSAVFAAKVYSDFHPDSKWKKWVWVGAIGIGGSTALLRYTAGKHFPSDVLLGSLTGATIGWLVPHLHLKGNQNLSFSPFSAVGQGFTLSYKF